MLLFGFNGRATRNFLILLVSMHYILFIDRVNLAAAAPVMQQDLGLSNLALGLAFSAFNYSYAPFQLGRLCRDVDPVQAGGIFAQDLPFDIEGQIHGSNRPFSVTQL